MILGSMSNSKHGMIIGRSARKCRNKKGFGKTRSLEGKKKLQRHSGWVFQERLRQLRLKLMVSTPEYPWMGVIGVVENT